MSESRPAERPSAETIEAISRLVAYPTTSRDSNLDLIHDLRDRLQGLGARSRLTFDDDRRKANLFATLGPTGPGGLVLSGHTDVVPVEGQAWSRDPFRLVELDGRLYGRGTADMKSFVAVVMARLPDLLRRDLRSPLHLAFSYDEEIGCIGVRRLIADIVAAGVQPSACIVGEPTLTARSAHRGEVVADVGGFAPVRSAGGAASGVDRHRPLTQPEQPRHDGRGGLPKSAAGGLICGSPSWACPNRFGRLRAGFGVVECS